MTDRVALAQIWPRLRPEHQQVLAALTAHGDYGLAAAALGISRNWFTTRLSQARREFLTLWHEGEPPSRPWVRDQRGTTTTDRLAAAIIIVNGDSYDCRCDDWSSMD